MSWFLGVRRKKKKFIIFKVDFEKTYDSISWDYLDQIMVFVGLGIDGGCGSEGYLKMQNLPFLLIGIPYKNSSCSEV